MLKVSRFSMVVASAPTEQSEANQASEATGSNSFRPPPQPSRIRMALVTEIPQERYRVEDFLAAFNSIERELKRRNGLEEFESIRTAAHRHREAHKGWSDFEAVMAFADLRNVIVHKRYQRFEYLAVPSEDVVEQIKEVCTRLLRPRTARDEFGRSEVVALETTTGLNEMLETVAENDFTQFPVYQDGEFAGLVTGKGLTRWLAQRMQDESILDLADHTVAEVLQREEELPNWVFVAANLPAEDVAFEFQDNPQLEAALVTENGKHSERIIGVATRWDLVALWPPNGG